jgi:hypothetical protein
MVIAGGIYGMMAVGQNAFKREPDLVDRQDNIRIALNLIERDLAVAGMDMGAWMQVFANPGTTTVVTDGDSAVVGPGSTGTTNGYASNGHYVTDTTAPNDPNKPDSLEFLAHTSLCPDVAVSCTGSGGNACHTGAVLRLVAPLPACYPQDGLVYVLWDSGGGKWGVNHQNTGNNGVNFPPGQADPMECNRANTDNNICHGSSDLDSGQPAPWNGNPQKIMAMAQIRYEIANDTDGVPSLFRSEVGGKAADGSGNRIAPPGGSWQLVARGIEDMQVVYFTQNLAGTLTPKNTPSAVVKDDYTTIVKQVRITLGARTLTALPLQGQVAAANAANTAKAIRGQLTRVVTIPAALQAFATIPNTNPSYVTSFWN